MLSLLAGLLLLAAGCNNQKFAYNETSGDVTIP